MMINDSRKPDSMMYIPELCGFVFLLESLWSKSNFTMGSRPDTLE